LAAIRRASIVFVRLRHRTPHVCRRPNSPGSFAIFLEFRDIPGDPSRLILGEQFRRRSPPRLVLEIDIRERRPLWSRTQKKRVVPQLTMAAGSGGRDQSYAPWSKALPMRFAAMTGRLRIGITEEWFLRFRPE
jgi:hypothetical protein